MSPIDKDTIALSHFPTRHQAFIFRAYEYVPVEKIARIPGADVDKVRKAAEEMLALMNRAPAIGYEASNHYYFSRGQLAEKVINCNYVIEFFSKKEISTFHEL